MLKIVGMTWNLFDMVPYSEGAFYLYHKSCSIPQTIMVNILKV